MNFHGGNILYDLGQLYVLILVLRAVLSWFPYSADSPINPVRRVVFTLTEPVLAPFRRVIPPVGMFDLSFLVAFIVVEVIVSQVLGPTCTRELRSVNWAANCGVCWRKPAAGAFIGQWCRRAVFGRRLGGRHRSRIGFPAAELA